VICYTLKLYLVLGIIDVIRAYPNWKLIVPTGSEAVFAFKAEQDPDYANFWVRLQTLPEKMIYSSFKEGLSRIAQDDSVMLSQDIFIKSFVMSNPFYAQKLQVLSTGKKEQGYIKVEHNTFMSRD
jgi:hypothetical protein